MRLILFIYAFLFSYFLFVMHNYLYFGITVLTIPALILILFEVEKAKIKNYKKMIEKAWQNTDVKPFLNVNKEPLYILELIPGLERVFALKIYNQRRNGTKIADFVDFANSTSIPLSYYEINKRILLY